MQSAPTEKATMVASIFSPGKRDTTTRESAKADRESFLKRKMVQNPEVPVFDPQGYRLHLDSKSGDVKRVVGEQKKPQGQMQAGTDARAEYAKPLSNHGSEVARLSQAQMDWDPDKEYIMDTGKAWISEKYVSGNTLHGGGVGRELVYDKDTHAASRSGYRMFQGGLGFIHTNSEVCRVQNSFNTGPCPCGFLHVP